MTNPEAGTISTKTRTRRRRGLAFLLFVVLAIGAFSYVAWRQSPTQPAVGGSLNGADQNIAAKQIIRVGTFNIHSGVGTDEKLDLHRTEQAIADTDICGLNEVHGASIFTNPKDQAQLLGEDLHRPYLFCPTERRWFHDSFGNGILSRLPVSQWTRIPMPWHGIGGCRNMTIARVEIGGGRTLNFLVTHLNRHEDRHVQVRMASSMFLALAAPAVLVADMNSDRKDPDLATLLATPGVHDCLGEVAGDKPGRIDWILARGCKTVAGGRIDNGASDHPMYWADLEPKP